MSDVGSAALPAAGPEFRVGRVLGESFNVLFKDFGKFFLIALLGLLPSALVTLAVGGRVAALGAVVPNYSASSVILIFVNALLWLFCYWLSQAATLYGAFQDMRGRPFLLGQAFARAFRRFFPVLGAALCFGVAVGLASLLLLVPGLMLLAAFYVSLPACVVESLGPLQSLSRSAALTKGHRWRVFGCFLILIVVSMIVGSLLRFLALAAGGITAALIVNLVWTAVYTAYYSVMIAVTYHDLRVLKEGIDIDRIAAVFD